MASRRPDPLHPAERGRSRGGVRVLNYDENADEHEPPRLKTAYKLPHHELIDGKLHVVWEGVYRAMNIMTGGRGGVDLPHDEIEDVHGHLAAHYEEFDEEPPELD